VPTTLSQTPSRPAVDAAIAAIDRRLALVLDSILHHPAVQRLESLWRALHRLVQPFHPHDNIQVDLLPLQKPELLHDLCARELHHSGLHHLVHDLAYASHGGRPYGLLCAAFDFGPDPADVTLLGHCAALAALAHVPFIADAAPALLGLRTHTELPRLRDLAAAQSGPRFAAWHRLRASPDARHLALCLPRFLLRPAHDSTTTQATLHHRETLYDPEHRLWGPACFLVAMRAAEAFAAQRWCLGLVGTRSGPALLRIDHPAPTSATLELLLPPRCERALASAGLVALTVDRATGRAILREAPTLQRSDDLAAQLPYLLLIGRLAHYLQRVQRERVGRWDDPAALQHELELWLRQLVADIDDPPLEVRARKPLRSASIALSPLPHQPGWHRCHLKVVPHLTHLGRPLTLELVGRLDLGHR
jgi:type VI secretion system protein ImpC